MGVLLGAELQVGVQRPGQAGTRPPRLNPAATPALLDQQLTQLGRHLLGRGVVGEAAPDDLVQGVAGLRVPFGRRWAAPACPAAPAAVLRRIDASPQWASRPAGRGGRARRRAGRRVLGRALLPGPGDLRPQGLHPVLAGRGRRGPGVRGLGGLQRGQQPVAVVRRPLFLPDPPAPPAWSASASAAAAAARPPARSGLHRARAGSGRGPARRAGCRPAPAGPSRGPDTPPTAGERRRETAQDDDPRGPVDRTVPGAGARGGAPRKVPSTVAVTNRPGPAHLRPAARAGRRAGRRGSGRQVGRVVGQHEEGRAPPPGPAGCVGLGRRHRDRRPVQRQPRLPDGPLLRAQVEDVEQPRRRYPGLGQPAQFLRGQVVAGAARRGQLLGGPAPPGRPAPAREHSCAGARSSSARLLRVAAVGRPGLLGELAQRGAQLVELFGCRPGAVSRSVALLLALPPPGVLGRPDRRNSSSSARVRARSSTPRSAGAAPGWCPARRGRAGSPRPAPRRRAGGARTGPASVGAAAAPYGRPRGGRCPARRRPSRPAIGPARVLALLHLGAPAVLGRAPAPAPARGPGRSAWRSRRRSAPG